MMAEVINGRKDLAVILLNHDEITALNDLLEYASYIDC